MHPTIAARRTLLPLLTLIAPLVAAADPVVWSPLDEPGCGGWIVDVAPSPHDPQRILITGDMLGVGLSTDGGDSWQATTGFATWEMGSVTWHPSDPATVWVGCLGGPHVSHDGGATWALRRGGMPATGWGYTAPVEVVLFDPSDPEHRTLLAFCGSNRDWQSQGDPPWGRVWRSTDGGERWTRLTTITAEGSNDAPDARGTKVLWAGYAPGTDGDRLYAYLSHHGVYASDDGGASWQPRSSGLPTHASGFLRVAQHPSDPDTLWLGLPSYQVDGVPVAGGVYTTTDGGRSWHETSQGIRKLIGPDGNTTTRITALAVSPSDPQRLYCVDGSYRTGVIYASRDGGASWRSVATKHNLGHDDASAERAQLAQIATAYPAGLSLTGLRFDPTDAEVAYGWGSEYVARTRDGGASWDDATSLRPDPARSDHWRGRGYSGLCSTAITFDRWRPGRLVVQAMDAAQAWLSTDDGASWSYHHGPETAWSGGSDASFCADGTLWVTTGPHGWMGIGRRDQHGGWTWFVGAEHGLPAAGWGRDGPGAIHAHPDDSARAWATVGGRLYATRDGGANWSVVADIEGGSDIAADPRDPERFYLSARHGVYATSDGERFTAIGGPRSDGRLTIDSRGRVLQAVTGGPRPGVWRYDPADASWTRLWDEAWAHDVAVDPQDPERLAVATNQNPYTEASAATGVWLSADGGASWSVANQGLAMERGWCIAIDPHDGERLVFGSMGRGFWQTRWPRSHAPQGSRRYAHTPADTTYADPTASILVDGAMSEGEDRLTHWSGTWEAGRSARDTEIAVAGSALRVWAEGAGTGIAYQQVEGRAGETFRLSGHLRSEGPATVDVAVMPFTADWKRNEYLQVTHLSGATDWRTFEGTVTIPDWAARFVVLVRIEGAGTAWLDEVEMRPQLPRP